jgi:hypothetical protein
MYVRGMHILFHETLVMVFQTPPRQHIGQTASDRDEKYCVVPRPVALDDNVMSSVMLSPRIVGCCVGTKKALSASRMFSKSDRNIQQNPASFILLTTQLCHTLVSSMV